MHIGPNVTSARDLLGNNALRDFSSAKCSRSKLATSLVSRTGPIRRRPSIGRTARHPERAFRTDPSLLYRSLLAFWASRNSCLRASSSARTSMSFRAASTLSRVGPRRLCPLITNTACHLGGAVEIRATNRVEYIDVFLDFRASMNNCFRVSSFATTSLSFSAVPSS